MNNTSQTLRITPLRESVYRTFLSVLLYGTSADSLETTESLCLNLVQSMQGDRERAVDLCTALFEQAQTGVYLDSQGMHQSAQLYFHLYFRTLALFNISIVDGLRNEGTNTYKANVYLVDGDAQFYFLIDAILYASNKL